MQVRHLPDVRVLTNFGPDGVTFFPGSRMEVEVEVTPRSYGIICTLLMLDFGEHLVACCLAGSTPHALQSLGGW
jgi:hypothetical protein